MFFYEIKVKLSKEFSNYVKEATANRESQYAFTNSCFVQNIKGNAEETIASKKKELFFVSSLKSEEGRIGVISKEKQIKAEEIKQYLSDMEIGFTDWELSEITFSYFQYLMDRAARNDFISSKDSVLSAFHLDGLARSVYRDDLKEGIISDETVSEPVIRGECQRSYSESLKQEISRILSSARVEEQMGHPVHYMIETDNPEFEELALKNLLHALYLKGRIASSRYILVDQDFLSNPKLEDLYRVAEKGCMLIQLQDEDDTEIVYAQRPEGDLKAAAALMKKYQNRTLTIFLLPKSCNKLKDMIFRRTQGCTFVEITEDLVTKEQAHDYLTQKAKDRHAVPDEKLYLKIREGGKQYALTELNSDFERWMNGYMKEKVFPEYADLACTAVEDSKKKPIGDAYEQLQKMVGLTEAKNVIREALDYYKAQKLFLDKGLQEEHPVMHMVFTGNPGTAKTTVARLFAEIMKDNGLLSVGKLIEVGRADLVGEYVGQTAPKVKEAFRRAKGSVLFIDEAYSLMDGYRGQYGDEAIDTIVQEMENLKDDMVVILAGYPEEMEQMLDRNPGLRSRIAYHVPFSDYSSWELYDIAELESEEKGMHLAADVKKKLIPIFEEGRKTKNFGNGRFVRNLIEKAQMRQASRLMQMDYDLVTREDVTTLTADDFTEIRLAGDVRKKAIGF